MTRYIPFPAYYDDMPIDISFIFRGEKPAGKHGFMKVDGCHFVFEDGTPARFWGVNFNGGACFPEFDYSKKVARRLAKTGINLVRFHQLDAEWNTPNIFSFSKGERIGSTLELHPESMERLDYLIKCLKDEGIYVYLDMNTYRNFKSGDGVENPFELLDAAEPYCYFNRRLIELQKKFMHDIWNHVNPYTGLAYKDDPAIVMSEIINERDFWGRGHLKIEPYVSEFRNLFKRWCQENQKDVDADAIDLNDDTIPELVEYKIQLQVDFYREMYDYMRTLGVKIPICGTNWQIHGALVKSNQMVNDFMDSHTYYYDWSWGERYKRFWNKAITQEPVFGMEEGTAMRALDRPLFVSEWDMPWPNEYRAESSILYAAVGALQGWDGWAIHTYAYGTRLMYMDILGKEVSSDSIGGVPYREGIFTTWNDPAKYGLFYHAALITRRGDVKEASTSYAVRYTDLLKGSRKIPALRGVAEYAKAGVCFDDVESGQAQVERIFEMDETIVDLSKGEITSETGELYRSWEKNYGTIDTQRTKVAYGFLSKNGEVCLDGMSVKAETDFAVIALSSLTDAGIETSDNMLLTTVGRAQNTDARFEGNQMYDFGKAPIQVEVIQAEVSIRTERKDLICWAVNAEGFFVGKVPSRFEDGSMILSLGKTMPSMYYLIQAE